MNLQKINWHKLEGAFNQERQKVTENKFIK
jgi:hypothetical protein